MPSYSAPVEDTLFLLNDVMGFERHSILPGFEALPRRWVVERTFAWLGRCRRLAKDWETSIESSTAWVNIASIRLMIRRLATYCFVS